MRIKNTEKMSENEVKKANLFKVMRLAIKLAEVNNGKDTILENKKPEYVKQILNNLRAGSSNYQKFEYGGLDYVFVANKAKQAIPDMKNNEYSPIVRSFVNDIAYMFEGSFKSIAKEKKPEEQVAKVMVEKVDHKEDRKRKLTCPKCKEDTEITNQDIINLRRIKDDKIIKCKCGETIMTVLTPTGKRSKLIKQQKEEEELMDMEALENLNELE